MEQVGRYRLHEQVGRTDVAEVHRAYEVTGGGLVRPVTLKRMLPEHARQFEHDAVLVEEARIQEQLDHPNVVKVVDLDQDAGVWFCVEERVEGRDLGTLLSKARQRGQKIDHNAATFIAIQILQGLAHAHGRTDAGGRPLGIVHRDLSPQNVWVGYDGEIRIGGFGYAEIDGRPQPGRPGLDRPRFGYVSPEQALGSGLDRRADVFAVGLILWELIAGRPAYEAMSDSDLLAKARRGSVPSIRGAAPEAGPELHEAVERATAFSRDHRQPSAQALRDDLARILFKREPTYGPSHLAALVSRILVDEAAEDRRRDAEARAELKGRSTPPFKPTSSPALMQAAAEAESLVELEDFEELHVEPEMEPAPAVPIAVREPMREPEPPAYAEPEPIAYQAPAFQPQAPLHFPQPDAGGMDAKPSLAKLTAGVTVLGLVGVAIFALSSDANMRLVQRKAREAVMGRKAGGKLTIDSLPSGAVVFFNDEPTGKSTPVTIANVESQSVHSIRVELEGEEPVTATVTVAANAAQTLNLTFKDAIVDLRVKVEPIGSEIYRNGRQIALAPTTMPVRAGEPFKIAIKKLGYKSFEQELTPERGKPVDIDVTLEKTEELLAAEAQEKAALEAVDDSGPKKSKKARKKRRR